MRSSPATNHSPRATHVRLGSGSEKSLVDCRQGRARAHRSERFNLEGHKAADQAPPPTDSCIARPHRPHPAYCVSGAHQSCGTSWCCPLLRCEGLLPGGEVWQREEDNSQGHSTAGTHSSDVAKLGGPTTADGAWQSQTWPAGPSSFGSFHPGGPYPPPHSGGRRPLPPRFDYCCRQDITGQHCAIVTKCRSTGTGVSVLSRRGLQMLRRSRLHVPRCRFSRPSVRGG